MKQDDTNNLDDIKNPTVDNTDEAQDDPQAVMIQGLQQQVEEWKNKYVRALADYQNLERRSADVAQEARKSATEVTVKKLLSAIDSLERAAQHIDDKGFHLSLKEFQKALDAIGVERMNVVGKKFDPLYMECIQLVDPDGDTVVEELAAGYMMHEKVLRVAQVKVGTKNNK